MLTYLHYISLHSLAFLPALVLDLVFWLSLGDSPSGAGVHVWDGDIGTLHGLDPKLPWQSLLRLLTC